MTTATLAKPTRARKAKPAIAAPAVETVPALSVQVLQENLDLALATAPAGPVTLEIGIPSESVLFRSDAGRTVVMPMSVQW